MATNFYFNNFPVSQITSEQLLVEDLVIEAMKINGMDVWYLPRTSRDEIDHLYGEDTLKTYTSAYPIEMYLENVTGMDGEGDFISKFGLEIRDEVTLLVARRRFLKTVKGLIHPREGDLVYVPLVQNFFEITFVEHENNQAMFYTLGRGRGGNVYVYALKMKQFVFSEEVIATGVPEVDAQIFDSYKRTQLKLTSANSSGGYISGEYVYQGATLNTATAQAVVYSYNGSANTSNIILTVIQTKGTFANSANVIGVSSNARFNLSYEDDSTQVNNTIFEDNADNTLIQDESDDIIDFTEHNPFGEA